MEAVYAVVFLDAIHYHVRSEGQVVKKAVYIAIGINLDGKKDVLGMWVGENESAKFWASVLNSLRNRGVQDILIACTDNLTGFSAAIEAVFPKTEIQNCIIHQLRNSSKYVSYFCHFQIPPPHMTWCKNGGAGAIRTHAQVTLPPGFQDRSCKTQLEDFDGR